MRGVNDWNVPDWRDGSAYPARETPAHVWAWEFLRRSPEYRDAWASIDHADIDDAQDRFGLAKWHDPRVNERGKGPFFVSRGVQQIWGAMTAAVEQHEVGYIFDLRLPLEAQFANACADAKSVQKIKKDKITAQVAIKVRADKFAYYLRILDALSEGADRSEIAYTLYSLNSNPLGTYDNQYGTALEMRNGGYRALAGSSLP